MASCAKADEANVMVAAVRATTAMKEFRRRRAVWTAEADRILKADMGTIPIKRVIKRFACPPGTCLPNSRIVRSQICRVRP
ncbi:hypothetical protein MESS4_560077 [Mesorhizobium sp. STM 4661]|nr:hypothetical protein MESS4_560077 [Mesorhizobium sp. STM 4661]